MLTTGYITAKKGPLYTVWLAANWEKKLTKSNISDLNLESTIKTILAPNMQIALRTSAHLLLGVVRIYSKKAKYLLIDCSEAFVRIKSAFRPGIIDLPKEAKGSAGHDPNILPVVFTDFDIPITDILSISGAEFLEPEPHLLNNLDKITLRRTPISSRHHNGAHSGEFDLRDSLTMDQSDSILREMNLADGDNFVPMDQASHCTTPRSFAGHDSRRDLDAPILNDLGETDDINLELGDATGIPLFAELDHAMEVGEPANGVEEVLDEIAPEPSVAAPDSEVLEPSVQPVNGLEKDTTADETRPAEEEATFMPDEGARGTYLLQPINTTKDRGKRKRKLVIDSCKVLTNKMIRTQLSDCGDTTYQTRTFPPISRRAIQCKARCADETLLTMPAVAVNQEWFPQPIIDIYTSNFTHEQFRISDDPSELLKTAHNPVADTSQVEIPHGAMDTPLIPPDSSHNQIDPSTPQIDLSHHQSPVISPAPGLQSPTYVDNTISELVPQPSPMRELEEAAPVFINDEDLLDPELDLNLQMNDMTVEREEELEARRWNQRVQIFLKTLKSNFKEKEEVSFFEDLTSSACSRKKAASMFYSSLLLAKENTIKVRQDQSYGDIILLKGTSNKDSSFTL